MAPRIPDSDSDSPPNDRVNETTPSDGEEDGGASKRSHHGRKRAKVSLDGRAANVKREDARRAGDKKGKSNASDRRSETPEASGHANGDYNETADEEDDKMDMQPPPKIETQPRDADGYAPRRFLFHCSFFMRLSLVMCQVPSYASSCRTSSPMTRLNSVPALT